MQFEIHYAEIALKGKNKFIFENKLIENIKKMFAKNNAFVKIKKKHNFLELEAEEKAKEILQKILGIRYFYVGKKIERKEDTLKKELLKYLKDKKGTFKIKVNRVDKKYEKTSVKLGQELAEFVMKNTNLEGELKKPDFFVKINVLKDSFFLVFDRIEGLGGLPIGVTGKVLCLISGGIDSPVATWMMMKRGCIPILYTLSCKEGNDITIIKELKEKLEEYSPEPIKLIDESLKDFNKTVLKLEEKNLGAYNCLVFKHFLLKKAEEIAKKEKCLGLVTGDNLAQVASQTLENLYAQRNNIEIPIYSPLIGFDKEEIINLSKKIGLYEISIRKKEDYFFLPKNPIIKTNLKEFNKIIKDIKN